MRAEGGYELIAGHRRKAASKWAGLDVMPVVIRELDDNQAVVTMVDSNLQREHLKPSEKAFAYKMKLKVNERGSRGRILKCQRLDISFQPFGPQHTLREMGQKAIHKMLLSLSHKKRESVLIGKRIQCGIQNQIVLHGNSP